MVERPLGVVLAAGSGTRLRPLTVEMPKPLVPLLNRPLVRYALDLCREAGMSEAVVVAGPEHRDAIAAAVDAATAGLTVGVAVQSQPRGPGDALASAGDALDGRPVVVLAVDTLIRGDLRAQVEAFERSDAVAGLTLHPTDRPREMGIAVLDGDRVMDLEEKPRRPRSDLAVVGVWMLAPAAVERVRRRPVINAKGESDLTATVASLLAEGATVRGWRLDGEWLDTGSNGALLDAQSRLLAGLPPTAVAASESALSGTIAAGDGVKISGSRLAGPVLLGDDVVIEGSELGPDVVVGDGAVLRAVRLSRSLVAPGARLDGVEHSRVVVAPSGAIGEAADAR